MTKRLPSSISGVTDRPGELVRVVRALAIRRARINHFAGINARAVHADDDRQRPRVRFATYQNEDTGEMTPVYLYSHDEIDTEIDRRVRIDPTRSAQYEVTRAKWHSQLG